jgi:hypothetical protein
MPRTKVSAAQPIHWSKDFVEHLRLVHFALVAVSSGLVVLVLSSKPYNPAIALRQIEEIMQLQKAWSPLWLSGQLAPTRSDVSAFDNVEEANKARYPTSDAPADNIEISYKARQQIVGTLHRKSGSTEPTMSFVFVFPQSSLFMPRWLSSEPKESAIWEGPDPFSTDGVPQTLAGFQAWWGSLRRSSTVNIPMEVCPKGGIMGAYVILSEKASVDSPEKLRRVELLVGNPWDSPQFGYVGDLPTKRKEKVFFAFGRTPQFVVNQEKLVAVFPNWHPGTFDQSFHDSVKLALDIWRDMQPTHSWTVYRHRAQPRIKAQQSSG